MDTNKVKLAVAENVRELLMFLLVWFPLRLVLVKLAWWGFGTDAPMTWGVAAFIAFIFPFVRPNLVLHYNSVMLPLEALTQRRPDSTAGKPN